MKRKQLIALVEEAAVAQGYAFHTGEERTINSTVRVYPAVWLVPPALRAHTGRAEGETTWRLTLHLMTLPAGGVQPESLWRGLESDALEIAGTLALSPAVCAVGGVQCAPGRGSLTVHGETSVTLTLDVTLWFIN
jgi:hypothetical protein